MLQTRWRFITVQVALLTLLAVVVWRVVYLQVLEKDFLINEGTSRWQRVEVVNAPRGMMTDRYGEPVAVSTPVVSLWADPRELVAADIPLLAEASGVSEKTLRSRARTHRAFMYIKRHLSPEQADVVLDLDLPGVYSHEEYKRFYPAGEVASHIGGFTDVEDRGQEGLELAFDSLLSSSVGRKEVIRDLLGRSVRDVGELEAARAGGNLQLTIDLRLQYLAYRELKKAITKIGATSGSVVMIDVKTGEVLALVNQPGYNPNDRSSLDMKALRNRAITDLFEPGSVMKPLTMAIALEDNKITPTTKINTSPGYLRLGKFSIRDFRNYGTLTATQIIQKSSNVGIVKVSQNLDKNLYWKSLYEFGFGESIGLGYPGEVAGALPNPMRWDRVTQGALAYGYGLSVTPMHLAQAYATLANGGKKVHAKLVMGIEVPEEEQQVVSAATSKKVLAMMETVVQPGGTATRANLDWYSIAGKTGTTHKVGRSGYEDAKYVSSFVGIAPASDPRVVAVVVVNEPPEDAYYGGEVAAPVFKGIMHQALPLLHVEPDKTPLELGGNL
ncbi:MAG: penicillin-binding protein 2 [Reinekea sp.]